MLTIDDIRTIVGLVSYKPGWSIQLGLDGDRPFIQIAVDETCEASRCAFSGEYAGWKSGKRYLSYHMCRQEIVGACFGLIQDAEMREYFRYRGRAIFNPHLDPDVLAGIATLSNMRENAMSMEESS